MAPPLPLPLVPATPTPPPLEGRGPPLSPHRARVSADSTLGLVSAMRARSRLITLVRTARAAAAASAKEEEPSAFAQLERLMDNHVDEREWCRSAPPLCCRPP